MTLTTTVQVGDRAAAAAAADPISRADAGAVLRRLGRPQPDPRRHRLRARRRHGRRVRARHAVGMAYLGRLRHRLGAAGARALASNVRFAAHHRTCSDASAAAARWPRSFEQDGERCVRIDMQVANQHGDVKLTGEAVIALPELPDIQRDTHDSKLEGKVALITGSGRGIGRASRSSWPAKAPRVVVNDLDAAPAEEVVADDQAAGGEAVACVGNVTATDFAERFVEHRRRQLRRARHHRQQRRLHLGQRDPEDDRRAVGRHARRAT